ncbi:hypothetical protein [Celeribacter litoreus]|uniref:hypothetical protein n=1 Tax=Celeribacter litoreus TaxID=2876714 RepID=UPI001CCF959B|nr:hypothetical protein [Celeribacter litoreus]MCA0043016.1 hypothetical protein [Celeribacter litoreus]
MTASVLRFAQLACAGATVGIGAAIASPYVPLTDEHLNPEPIVIEVPAEDLARCIATLEQVFFGPVTDATVQSVSLDPAERGPEVTCVVE